MINLQEIIKEEFNNLIFEKRAVSDIISKEENIGELLEFLKEKYNYDDVYVSFRDSQHVTKINPNNEFNTPTGLYTYKLSKYTYNPIYDIDEFGKLFPYASERKYIFFYVLKDNANILNSKTSDNILDDYVEKIKRKFNTNKQIKQLCDNWSDDTYQSYYSKSIHNTHKFWLFIYDVLPYAYKDGNKKNRFSMLCRELNIDGFDDDTCYGWIHPSEKCQTVFFRSNIFKNQFTIKRNEIFNVGDYKEYTEKEFINLINKNKLDRYDISENPDKYLALFISKNPKIIRYVKSYLKTLSNEKITEMLSKSSIPDKIITFLDWPKDFKLEYNVYISDLLQKHFKFIKNIDINKLTEYDIEIIIDNKDNIKKIEPYFNIINPNTLIPLIYDNSEYLNKINIKLLSLKSIYNLLLHNIKTLPYLKEYLNKLGEKNITYILTYNYKNKDYILKELKPIMEKDQEFSYEIKRLFKFIGEL